MESDEIDAINISIFKWSGVWTVIDALGLVIVLLVQSSLLNYYIAFYNDGSSACYFLFLVDFFILSLFITSILLARKHYKDFERTKNGGTRSRLGKTFINLKLPSIFGTLPLIYLAWFVYGTVLIAKTFIIFLTGIPEQMVENLAFRSLEFLELGLAAVSLVFLLWVEVHKNIIIEVSKKWIKAISADLISHTVFELFDSIFFLDLIIPNSTDKIDEAFIKITSPMKDTIICLASLNFIYPTLSLFKYSLLKAAEEKKENQDYDSKTTGLNIIIHLVRLLMVNIPYLLIRTHLSSSFNKEISIFALKNILGLLISIRSLTFEIIKWFKMSKSRKHVKNAVPQITVDETPDKAYLKSKDIEMSARTSTQNA